MWQEWVVRLLLAALTIPSGSREGETARERVSLPIEVLGADGTTASRTVTLDEAQSDSVRFLWLETHGLHYASQASVQVNQSAWIPLNNETMSVSEPGRSYGGIGGAFATLGITVALPKGAVVAGVNTIRFRFNGTDGLASGYRVLAWNFLTAEGGKVIPPEAFVEDDPEAWKAPLGDTASHVLGYVAAVSEAELTGEPGSLYLQALSSRFPNSSVRSPRSPTSCAPGAIASSITRSLSA